MGSRPEQWPALSGQVASKGYYKSNTLLIMLQVNLYFMIEATNGRSMGSTRSATPDGEHRLGANRSPEHSSATLRREPMTPILLLLAFLLMLDVRPARSKPRLARRPGLAAARLTLAWSVGRCAHLTIRPLSSRLATAEPSWRVRHRASVADRRILAALGGRGLGSEE